MGCLTRVVFVGLIAAGATVAYVRYGDRVPTSVTEAAKTAASTVGDQVVKGAKSVRIPRAFNVDSARGVVWTNFDDEPAGNIDALRKLATRSGPAFVTITPQDLAGMLVVGVTRALPRSATNAQLAVLDDEILMRAVVDLRDFAGDGAVGAIIGTAVTGRDTLRLAGTLELQRRGLALYHVRSVRLKGIGLPSPMIPSVLGQFTRPVIKDSVPGDALPLAIPRAVADVRVVNSRVTVYKAVP